MLPGGQKEEPRVSVLWVIELVDQFLSLRGRRTPIQACMEGAWKCYACFLYPKASSAHEGNIYFNLRPGII